MIKELTREQAILEMVEQNISNIESDFSYRDKEYITDILRQGWKGYDEMTDEEIASEYGDDFPDSILKIVEG